MHLPAICNGIYSPIKYVMSRKKTLDEMNAQMKKTFTISEMKAWNSAS